MTQNEDAMGSSNDRPTGGTVYGDDSTGMGRARSERSEFDRPLGGAEEDTSSRLPLTTIVGLFRRWDDAAAALDLLSTAGFTTDDTTLIVPKKVADQGRRNDAGTVPAVPLAAAGAGAGGTAAGGTGGANFGLSGLAPIAFLGLGDVMYNGPLFGHRQAAAGTEVETRDRNLVETLTDADIPPDRAELYAEGVKRGGILVAVQSRDRSAEALNLMLQANAADVESLGKEWQRTGWQGFDTTPPGRDYPTLTGR